MVIIKSKSETEKMKEAGRITYETLKEVSKAVKPGVTTMELDKIAEDYIRSRGCTGSFKGYGGFPGTVCASVNDTIIHGFPDNVPLKDGDIVSIDVGACFEGYHGDACRTFKVGKVDSETERLIQVTRQSFFEALKFARDGYRISDISRAVQTYVEANGFSVLRGYCGHGVGADLHEDPEVPNYVTKSRGIRLRPGMVIAVEPMICGGSEDVYVADNEWAVITRDGKNTAHYENTILITAGDPVLLTLPDGFPEVE